MTTHDGRPGSAVTPSGMTRDSWLQSRLQGGVGAKTRDAARTVLGIVVHDPAGLLPAVSAAEREDAVEALHKMIDETERWKDAWASEHVDKDRQVRAAMARSADCTAHGEEITQLQAQLAAAEARADRTEAARLVMLGWYQACVSMVAAARQGEQAGKPLPDSASITEWMEKSLPRIGRAHQKAWHHKRTADGRNPDDQS